MSRIASRFEELRASGEGALIAFITAGDPKPSLTPRIAGVLAKHADILELGIPFSDPIADGPTIQAADDRALRSGTTPREVFRIIKRIRRAHYDLPLVTLSYYNIVLKSGVENFMKRLAAAGGDGIIVPDLPTEESGGMLKASKKYGIDLIFLASPTTTPARLKRICNMSSGFVYLVSLLGVTGARKKLSSEIKSLITRARRASNRRIPLAVGFGMSRPEHVSQVLKYGADAAIVGSAFVDLVARYLKDERRMLREFDKLGKSLKAATKLR